MGCWNQNFYFMNVKYFKPLDHKISFTFLRIIYTYYFSMFLCTVRRTKFNKCNLKLKTPDLSFFAKAS